MRRALLAGLAALLALAPAWSRSPGQAALDRGTAAYKRGAYEEARRSFREAVDLDPSLIKAWENLGWAHHRLGDDREAIRIWNTVLKLEPDNVGALNAVGEVETSRGRWEEAADALSRSLARDGNQPDVRLRLGVIEETLRRPDAAAAQYRAILARRPDDDKARSRLSDLEEARGRLAEAESVLRAGRSSPAIAKKLARVLGKKGDAAFREGRFTDAREAYREAERWDSSDPLYPANLGWAERKSGRNAAAIDAWRRAISRGSKAGGGLWRAIGDAAKDDSRFDLAREAYAKAAALDPGSGA
ncbi:MAG TPA: tetratricopeptide repeat protein, partial [Candidatus Polarisedimenticolaceae bacterium]|nr:tetratricopeptide repeat protein [Candidatus Polarisedimenticolaceae bacterium]